MNILMLTSELSPSWGGIGTYVTELVRNLPDEMNIHVVTPKRTQLGSAKLDGYEALTRLPENAQVHYLGTARDTFMHYSLFQLACRVAVPGLVKKYSIDLIHSQNTMPDLFLSPERLGLPIVTTVHSMEDERLSAIRTAVTCSECRLSELERSERMSLMLGRVLHAAGRMYYRDSRYYVAVSQWTKTQILRHQNVDAKRIRVIYNGVDGRVFSPKNASRARGAFPELVDLNVPKVLFLSRVTASKGIYILMKAIPRVLDKVDAHFIFAGPGMKLPEHQHPNNVTELGYVDHRLTPFLYALADAFVLPSFYENFPLSILEAMASGCAVVASDVGGISELIVHEQNGLLVRSGNVDDIVDALTTLLCDDALKTTLAHNARRSICNLDWKGVAADMSDYYQTIVPDAH